jgi:hypothetical protein
VGLTPEDGELRVDLKGEIAGIPALAADSKKARHQGDGPDLFVEQVELVAGTRNCLYLLLIAHGLTIDHPN